MILILIVILSILVGFFVNLLSEIPYQKEDRINYFDIGKLLMLPTKKKNRFFLVMLICVVLGVSLFFLIPHQNLYLISYIFTVYLVWITIVDVEHREIILGAIIPSVIVLGFFGVYLHGFWSALVGCLSGFVVQCAIYLFGLIYKWVTVKLLKRDNLPSDPLGFGDVIITGVIGLVLGWPHAIYALIGAWIIGCIYAWAVIVYKSIRNHDDILESSVPYIVFISLGTLFSYALFCIDVI